LLGSLLSMSIILKSGSQSLGEIQHHPFYNLTQYVREWLQRHGR
jgi:hypothetical protein